MGIDVSVDLNTEAPEYLGIDKLSIVLIGPNEERREAVALALARSASSKVHAFSSYPPSLGDVPRLLEQNHDVIIIDLDSDPEYALDLVESLDASGSTTVMVYSSTSDPDLLVRCMRAGAREFLTLPMEFGVMAESLVRAAARRPVVRATTPDVKRAAGRLLAFMGAKGGTGVTTLAANFAVALAQEPDQSTLFIDLDLPFGDAALNLGIVSEFSTIDALKSYERLDGSLLTRLVAKHSSGVSVLPAPGRFQLFPASTAAIRKLLTIARQEFDNVVVDMGAKIELTGTTLFKDATTIYLVTQAGVSELRNSNRLIGQFGRECGSRLEVVINRYEPRMMGVTDKDITKALTRPAQWKISNDYASVKRMQVEATPLALGNSAISKQIRQMAKSAIGQPAVQAKKKGFSLFG